MNITDLQAYAATTGHVLTDQAAGLVAAMIGLAPTRPTVADLDAWIARFSS